MLGKILFHYLKTDAWRVIAVPILSCISTIGTLFLPRINAEIIDKGVAKGDIGYIWAQSISMIIISFVVIMTNVMCIYWGARVSMRMGRDIRNDLYAQIGDYSEKEVSHFGAGSLITRVTNDVQQLQTLVMVSAAILFSAPLLSIGGIIMAVRQDMQLSVVIFVAFILLFIVATLVCVVIIPLFSKYQKTLDAINRVMREQLTGVRVVRAFVREKIEEKRFRQGNDDITLLSRKIGSLFVLMFPLVFLISDLAVVAILWFGGFRIDSGATEIGTLMSFIQYVFQILMGIAWATMLPMVISRGAVSANRIGKVMETTTSLANPPDPIMVVPDPGAFEFRDVSFAYPEAESPIFSHVNATVKCGETLAIIGSTGVGKTTLISLIPRLFDATGGQVLVGGVDVKKLDLNVLWRGLSLIPQQSYLFSGTVASNLRFGREDATDEELWEALTLAQAKEFVENMDGGLDATIAQGGTNVSGGQRQRLAIARAMIHQPDIMIFDDSFSALDVVTDAKVREGLWENLPHVTKVIVAQRVSTVVDADQIMVLDSGQQVGLGTHHELLETCSTYREIVDSQVNEGTRA